MMDELTPWMQYMVVYEPSSHPEAYPYGFNSEISIDGRLNISVHVVDEAIKKMMNDDV